MINGVKFDFFEEYANDDFEIVFLLEYNHSFKGDINLILGYKENKDVKKDYFMLFKPIVKKAEKVNMDYSDGERIEQIIENSKVEIKPPQKCGLDGCYYVFTLFNNGNFAQYSWWGEPEEK